MIPKKGIFFIPIAILLMITACTANKPLETLNADKLSSMGNDCQEIANRHIETSDTKDAEKLREIYSDDILHFDSEPAFIGIEDVADTAKKTYAWFPNWQILPGDTFISADKCFGTWWNWGIMDHTKDNPAPKYDLLETWDGIISYWKLFYPQDFFGTPLTDNALEIKFASTWSQGDPGKIKDLYTKDAVLEDTLFDFSSNGQRKITNYASRFLAKAPDSRWELITSFERCKAKWPYNEEYPCASEGGIFSVLVTEKTGQACELIILVVLTPNDEGLIIRQETYYSADSLINCGWAE